MSEPDNEAAGQSHMGIRLAILLVPVPLTARLLAIWLPFSIAGAGSLFAWMLLIYWFPRKAADISLRKWLLIAGVSSMAVFLVAIVAPGWS